MRTVEELDGVFLFVIHDKNKNEYYAGRDPFGVRPGFIGYENQNLYLESKAKALANLCKTISPLPPEHGGVLFLQNSLTNIIFTRSRK